LDFLSERSGPNFGGGTIADTKKYSFEVLQYKLERYKTKLKKTVLTREALIDFVGTEYGVSMTMLSATDAILFCRGPGLDQSENYN